MDKIGSEIIYEDKAIKIFDKSKETAIFIRLRPQF